jgi:uncharacterized protein YbjQ (UPF0145 family)
MRSRSLERDGVAVRRSGIERPYRISRIRSGPREAVDESEEIRMSMILTTTATVEGKPAREYLGIVTGEAILGANVVRDFFAGIRDIVGGRAGAYEKELRKAREIALAELEAEALRRGADAVIGIDLDYETVGQGGSMLMVSVSGTAIRL